MIVTLSPNRLEWSKTIRSSHQFAWNNSKLFNKEKNLFDRGRLLKSKSWHYIANCFSIDLSPTTLFIWQSSTIFLLVFSNSKSGHFRFSLFLSERYNGYETDYVISAYNNMKSYLWLYSFTQRICDNSKNLIRKWTKNAITHQ